MDWMYKKNAFKQPTNVTTRLKGIQMTVFAITHRQSFTLTRKAFSAVKSFVFNFFFKGILFLNGTSDKMKNIMISLICQECLPFYFSFK